MRKMYTKVQRTVLPDYGDIAANLQQNCLPMALHPLTLALTLLDAFVEDNFV